MKAREHFIGERNQIIDTQATKDSAIITRAFYNETGYIIGLERKFFSKNLLDVEVITKMVDEDVAEGFSIVDFNIDDHGQRGVFFTYYARIMR